MVITIKYTSSSLASLNRSATVPVSPPGTALQIDVQEETLIMQRIVKGYPQWRTMRGMLGRQADLLDDLAQERAAELAREDARNQGS